MQLADAADRRQLGPPPSQCASLVACLDHIATAPWASTPPSTAIDGAIITGELDRLERQLYLADEAAAITRSDTVGRGVGRDGHPLRRHNRRRPPPQTAVQACSSATTPSVDCANWPTATCSPPT